MEGLFVAMSAGEGDVIMQQLIKLSRTTLILSLSLGKSGIQ